MKREARSNIASILDISIKNKKGFLIAILFSLFSAIVSLLIPLVVGTFMENLTDVGEKISPEKIFSAVLIFIVVYILQGLSSYVLGKIGIDAIKNLQCYFEKHIMHLDLEDSNVYAPGDWASRVTNDIGEVSAIVTVIIPSMVKNFLIVLCTTIILWLINSKLTMLLIIMLVLLLIISHPVNSKLENLYKVHQTILGDISAQVARCVSNMIMIKAYVGEKKEYQYAKSLVKILRDNLLKIVKRETVWNVFLSCALMFDVVLVIVFAKDMAGVNVLSVYILYMVQMLSPAVDLVNSITKFVESNGAFQRIVEALALHLENKEELPEIIFDQGNISLSRVSFCYREEKKILKDISIEIPEKSIVAIVGPSGVGKTTLFSLILKLYKEYEGKIEIDSKDIKGISTSCIRNQIAYVSQNNLVLNGSVMDNLRYGKNEYLEPEDVVRILQDNQMLELFDDFSNGLDTDIGENGHKLSEGQKQRINIARAIISKPIILLLDEITSNLDSETEHQIMSLIERQTTTTTIVIIAHRLNTIRNADLIYVMNEQGKIESYGTHQYLIENCEIYKKLVRNAVYCG